MAGRKATLSVVHPQQNPAVHENAVRRPKQTRPRRNTRGPQKFTLAEAFSPFTIIDGEDGIDGDVERGLRSVGFLLHSLSDIGNEDVEGFVAHGLGYVLEHYADRVSKRAGRNG